MWTGSFWKDALERALKTIAQTLLALWLVGDVALNALTIDWANALGISLGAAVLSILTSIVSAPTADKGTASLVKDVGYLHHVNGG